MKTMPKKSHASYGTESKRQAQMRPRKPDLLRVNPSEREPALKTALRKLAYMLPHMLRSRLLYVQTHRSLPNFRNPNTFSEFIHHRKLYQFDPRFAVLADKVRVKDIVSRCIGLDFVIPNLFVGPQLPPQSERNWPLPFIIKCNHGSGMNVIVRRTEDIDWEQIEENIHHWRATRFFDFTSEYWYQDIPQRILVEPLLGEQDTALLDYRFFVFGGKVAFVMVSREEKGSRVNDFVSREFCPLDIKMDKPPGNVPLLRPEQFEKMVTAAETLGKGFDFVRIDMYESSDGPLFGEITFSPNAGRVRFATPGLDRDMGTLWREARVQMQGYVEEPGSASALAFNYSKGDLSRTQ